MPYTLSMKKLLFVLFLGLVSLKAFADDTIYGLRSGALVQITDKHPSVSMINEVITIDAYESYYEINVDFLFYNDSNAQELTLGFPVTEFYGNGQLYDFEFWFNDKPQQRKFTPIKADETQLYKTRNAYTIPVKFESGLTKTRVKYKNAYGSGPIIAYYYGSGAAWKGKIQSVELYLTNHTSSRYFRAEKTIKAPLEFISDNTLYLYMKDVNPDPKDCFSFLFFDFSTNNGESKPSITSIKPGRDEYYTKEQYRILRNTIFAAHGYTFKSQDLQDYFSKASWYKPNPDYSDAELLSEEKTLIDQLRRAENNWPNKKPVTPEYKLPQKNEKDTNPYRAPTVPKFIENTSSKEKTLYPLTLTSTNADNLTWDSIEPLSKYPADKCKDLVSDSTTANNTGTFKFYYNPNSATPEKGLLYNKANDTYLCVNYDAAKNDKLYGHTASSYYGNDPYVKGTFILITSDSKNTYCIIDDSTAAKRNSRTSEYLIYSIGNIELDQGVFYKDIFYFNNTQEHYFGKLDIGSNSAVLNLQNYDKTKKLDLYILSTDTYYDYSNVKKAANSTPDYLAYLMDTEYYKGGDGRGESDYVYNFFLATTDKTSKKPVFNTVTLFPSEKDNSTTEKIEKIFSEKFVLE